MCYVLVAVVLVRIIGDLFRDRELGDGMKAVWSSDCSLCRSWAW